jgi:hypothetical protein
MFLCEPNDMPAAMNDRVIVKNSTPVVLLLFSASLILSWVERPSDSVATQVCVCVCVCVCTCVCACACARVCVFFKRRIDGGSKADAVYW